MKIGPFETKPASAPPPERKGSPATPAKQAEPSTQVALSPAATSIAGAAADPSFDAAKVDRMAQAIRDGNYKVNPYAIADKLIINAAELLGHKPS